MPDEPQRESEKALQTWAKKRRDEAAPAELHPATRRMLQGEVARVYGQQRKAADIPPSRSWLAVWFPRLALAGGAIAAAVVLAVVLWPEGRKGSQWNFAKAPSSDPILKETAAAPAPDVAKPTSLFVAQLSPDESALHKQ